MYTASFSDTWSCSVVLTLVAEENSKTNDFSNPMLHRVCLYLLFESPQTIRKIIVSTHLKNISATNNMYENPPLFRITSGALISGNVIDQYLNVLYIYKCIIYIYINVIYIYIYIIDIYYIHYCTLH